MQVGVSIGLLVLATAVDAQTARLTGRVYDEVTGQPVPGVVLRLTNAPIATRSNDTGAYVLDGVPAGRSTIRVEAARYTSLIHELEVDAGVTVILPLIITPVAVLLDQLAFRSARAERETGMGRATVRDRDMGDRGAPTATDALAARVPGARVVFYGGSVGLATRILLRGVKSLTLPGDPLYYVDGVLMPPPVPGTRGRFGQASILDLIDPETIERIEVITGAAANANFGLGANNGVILIYTKR